MSLLSPVPQEQAATLTVIEGGLTAIAIALSFALPRLGQSFFSRIEWALAKLARNKGVALLVVGLSGLLLRLAVLPLHPIPLPFVPDDFSFLLAADTFAHGRLTNPTPAMWVHFESIHIDMIPTYMSMYFPAQGLVMAASKVLFGHPWFGLLIVSALMCAGLCWMLQAWMPPSWALLGGMLAVLRLAIFSYWTNTYHAAGSIAALAGALVLGGLPRFVRTPRLRYAFIMAAGIAILGITRPYEGMLLCIPVLCALCRWFLYSKKRPSAGVLFRRIAAPAALIIATAVWLGYYNYRAFGSPLTLPYTVNRATYAMAPYFAWQAPRAEPAYNHHELRRFYQIDELDDFKRNHSLFGFFKMTLIKAVIAVRFFAGLALLPPLLMLRRVLLDRCIRFLVLCLIVLTAGMVIEIFLVPHYVAPFVPALYAVGLQAMRHLWHWTPGDQYVGRTIVRLTVTVCLVMALLRVFDRQLRLPVPEWPASGWNCQWFGPDHFGTERAEIEHNLEQLPGEQLVIVRYSAHHNPQDEWVYNAADIDASKVIWAREMDPANNLDLFRYYKNRKVWLVQPDLYPNSVSPYPVPEQVTVSIR
jgi:hypothetical protein